MFRRLIKILVILYPLKLHQKFQCLLNILYSSWIKHNIPNAARSCIIWRGANLIGGKYITIGEHTILRSHANLIAIDFLNGDKFNPIVKIGDYCHIHDYLNLTCTNSITIGNHVLMGKRVTIIDNSHGNICLEFLLQHPSDRKITSKGPIVIDDDVWIADKVTICAGVHIGKGSVVGANSVVTHDVPPYTLVAGSPARIIKQFKVQ